MAKNDNSITCLALLVGVLIFIMYLKSSNKIVEGHEATPEALATAVSEGANVRTTRPQFKECIKSCGAIHLADSTYEDRLQLVKDIKDYKTLALTQQTQASDTTTAVARQLAKIGAFEGRFKNFTSEGDSSAALELQKLKKVYVLQVLGWRTLIQTKINRFVGIALLTCLTHLEESDKHTIVYQDAQ